MFGEDIVFDTTDGMGVITKFRITHKTSVRPATMVMYFPNGRIEETILFDNDLKTLMKALMDASL